jgi:hypothetical protein
MADKRLMDGMRFDRSDQRSTIVGITESSYG